MAEEIIRWFLCAGWVGLFLWPDGATRCREAAREWYDRYRHMD